MATEIKHADQRELDDITETFRRVSADASSRLAEIRDQTQDLMQRLQEISAALAYAPSASRWRLREVVTPR